MAVFGSKVPFLTSKELRTSLTKYYYIFDRFARARQMPLTIIWQKICPEKLVGIPWTYQMLENIVTGICAIWRTSQCFSSSQTTNFLTQSVSLCELWSLSPRHISLLNVSPLRTPLFFLYFHCVATWHKKRKWKFVGLSFPTQLHLELQRK